MIEERSQTASRTLWERGIISAVDPSYDGNISGCAGCVALVKIVCPPRE